jgi:plastocyanin
MAVPGSRAATYGTLVVVVEPGDDLSLVNLELFPHDVRSVAKGPDDTPWCKPPNPNEPRHHIRNPRQFPMGKCPLLWSPAISMTLGAVETKVFGTENLVSGKTVEFYCTVFPNMRGSVVVP